jgi:DNA-binding NarL/FixJ family response regulator
VSPSGRAATVIVVARDAMLTARVEAAARSLAGWRVEIASLARAHQLLPEHPTALVVLALGEAETRRALRSLRDAAARPAIVALAEQPARLWTSSLRALGLHAVLPPRATSDELASTLHAVQSGLFVLNADALATATAAQAPPLASTSSLTAREREILELIAEGAANRRIAARLAISRHTVKFHVASILAKLGARTRTEAVTLALRAGLLAV